MVRSGVKNLLKRSSVYQASNIYCQSKKFCITKNISKKYLVRLVIRLQGYLFYFIEHIMRKYKNNIGEELIFIAEKKD